MKSKVLVSIVLMTAAAILVFGFGLTPRAAQEQGTEVVSSQQTQATAVAAKQVSMEELPQLAPYRGHYREIPDHPEAGEMEGFKENGPIPGYKGGEPSPISIDVETQTPGASQAIAGGGEAACGNWIPSDHALATNSSYVVQVLNSCLIIYNSSGTLQSGYPKNLNGFFGVTENDVVGDIRCLYDWKSSRFILVAEDFTANNIQLAVSKNSTPTGAWWLYTLSATSGNLPGSADFPMLGQTLQESGDSDGAIYISFDRFSTKGPFQDDVIWALPKTPIYSGKGFSWSIRYNLTWGGRTMDHVQPASVISRQDRPQAEFLVNTLDFNNNCVSSSPCNGLVIWAWSDAVPAKGQSQTLTGTLVKTANSYIYPVTAAQPGSASGSSCAINTGNTGISSTVYWSAGDLYLAATTAAHNGQASDGWIFWQMHPYLKINSSGVPVLGSTAATIRDEVCWGCNGFTGDATYSEFYPAPQPDDEGNVTIVFNESSDKIYPLTAYISKRTTQATGGFPDGGVNLKDGQAAYCQIDGIGRNRWGDYTATSPYGTQNATQPTFWFAGQYSDSGGNWATEIGKNTYSSMGQN